MWRKKRLWKVTSHLKKSLIRCNELLAILVDLNSSCQWAYSLQVTVTFHRLESVERLNPVVTIQMKVLEHSFTWYYLCLLTSLHCSRTSSYSLPLQTDPVTFSLKDARLHTIPASFTRTLLLRRNSALLLCALIKGLTVFNDCCSVTKKVILLGLQDRGDEKCFKLLWSTSLMKQDMLPCCIGHRICTVTIRVGNKYGGVRTN